MDIKITLTQRHIDAFCADRLIQDGITDEDFSISKILSYIEEIATTKDVKDAIETARENKLDEVSKFEKATCIVL